MPKRSSENIGKSSKMSKKNYKTTDQIEIVDNIEKTVVNHYEKTEEPPSSISTKPKSKYDFNFWKKNETKKVEFNLISMCELNLGMCLNQSIRFRVSFKSGRKLCKNGYMFNFHIAADGNEMQATAFPEGTSSFFDLIQFNRTYQLTNFNVKKEESNFPLFVGNGKYICLLSSSEIESIDDNLIPELQFNFVPLDKLKDLEPKSKCDFMGIIIRNFGKEIIGDNKVKRDLWLTDKSKETIILTLWGDEYDNFDSTEITVIIHNGLVHDYNGQRSISCAARTLFWSNPRTNAAEELKSWFDSEKPSHEENIESD